MKLQSCDSCGVLLDIGKLIFPDPKQCERKSSPSRPSHDKNVISMAAYKARRKRAVCRRTVICMTLCLLGLAAGALVLQRDGQMQVYTVEVQP